MKAYRLKEFNSIDNLVLSNDDMPEPKPNEVLVRVRANSLNYRDLMIIGGRYPMICKPGYVQLSDAAGDIVKVGSGVSRFKVGDRVVNTYFPRWFGGRLEMSNLRNQYGSECDGWLVEYKAIDEEALVSIPPHLTYEEAATLPCAAVTAWSALSGPTPVAAGDTVLIQGTGGVSLFALQLAKLCGARVIATTSSEEKEAKLRALGADAIINYVNNPEWDVAARELTGGQGVSRVIEIGGAGTIARSARATAVGGEVSIIGVLAGASEQIDFMQLFMSGATLRRIAVGSRDDFESMNRAISFHELRPVIDRSFVFDEAAEAIRHFEGRGHFGKVVIVH